MAGKKKALTGLNIVLLASVAAASAAGATPGYMFVSADDAAPFLSHTPPLMEQNGGMTDADGKLATRATADGIAYSASHPANGAVADVEKVKPTFQIFKNVTLPAIKRGGGIGTETYPFATMEVHDAFFVPATADKPEPAKALASTVSSATRRFSVQDTAQPTKTIKGKNGAADRQMPNMKATKRFELRRLEDGKDFGAPGVAGALISRTA
jgi:hypothetical protein